MPTTDFLQSYLRPLRVLPLRAFARALRKAWGYFPLSGRGILALFCSILALRWYALSENDLVAATIGTTLLFLLAVDLLLASMLGFRLRKRLKVDLIFDTEHPLVTRPVSAGMVLHNSSMPPFFFLEAKRCFAAAGVISPTHLIRGRVPATQARHLADTIRFPHRGAWALDGVQINIKDSLGFVAMGFIVKTLARVEVHAAEVSIKPLPIVAATSRLGDLMHQSTERTGDLFDIKQYDPSDGVKRILWKTYARSGQLVVRRPEPAIVPEGEVALYLVAPRQADYVAGSLLRYVRILKEQDMVVLFGTDGGTPGLATEFADIESSINSCVWSPAAGSGLGLDAFLNSLQGKNHLISQMIVFGPKPDEKRVQRGETPAWVETVTKVLEQRQIKPVLALVPAALDSAGIETWKSGQANAIEKVRHGVELARSRFGKKTFSPKTRAPHVSSDWITVEAYE